MITIKAVLHDELLCNLDHFSDIVNDVCYIMEGLNTNLRMLDLLKACNERKVLAFRKVPCGLGDKTFLVQEFT